MRLITPSTAGRQLMVLDDAETIARQARRRAAAARRRRETAQVGAAGSLVLAIAAVILGASLQVVAAVTALLLVLGWLAYQRLQDRQAAARRQALRSSAGHGIGTPRPKGGFSTIRHRSGEPVWVDRRAA